MPLWLTWAFYLVLISQSSTIVDNSCVRKEAVLCDSNFENCFTVVSVECMNQ